MENFDNLILDTDSYKTSHFKQYDPAVTEASSYIEPRKGDEITFFGPQMYTKRYLSKPLTIADIDEAESYIVPHGTPFNRAGWVRIVSKHDGWLPLEISSLPEGTVHGAGIPQVQIRTLDPEFVWLGSYIETALLRATWYPSSVASISRGIKKDIKHYLELTADDPVRELPFKLHDFGARGVSSKESAGIGGIAHLVNFKGTDTLEALRYGRRYYSEHMAGFSIPAAEHSTITSWGREGELDAFRNMLTAFPDSPIIAVVSDTYNIFRACDDLWGGVLKGKVQALGTRGRTLVIRPDSGDPRETLMRVFEILFDRFREDCTTNSKGYRLLPPYLRVIQGDGVNAKSIVEILEAMKNKGYSASNIVFGMGGALLQKVDRDTYSYAMKLNEVVKDGKSVPVFKDPITDSGKSSKKGRQAVVASPVSGKLTAIPEAALGVTKLPNLLTPLWSKGKLLRDDTLSTIRARAEVA
ncbi:MAG: nicotinate phosphoribosyltransferase [Betaproteobacteria bacterium]